MQETILCPQCGELVHYSMHFGAYICRNCPWEDRSPGQRRSARQAALSRFLAGDKMKRSDLKALLRTCEAG